MKVKIYENSGDMLLMAVYNDDKLVYAHDFDGDYDQAEIYAAIAVDANADDMNVWDGNIIEDEVILAQQYGIVDTDNAGAALRDWIADNETGNTNTGIKECEQMLQ